MAKERIRLSLTVRDQLAERISSGAFGPGSRLPPEPDLASDLGVSRATLREALRSLEEDGFLRRKRGAGTFVTHRPRLRNNLDVNFGVTDAIRIAGQVPGTEDLRVSEAPATPEEARQLAIERGDILVVVERVRTADRRPVVYSRDVISAPFLGRARDSVDRLADGSLYDLLQRELGVVIHHGVASFDPVKADRTVAAKLRVIRGALLLHLRQVDFDEGGLPVLYSQDLYLADAFDFTVARRGPGARSGSSAQGRVRPARVG